MGNRKTNVIFGGSKMTFVPARGPYLQGKRRFRVNECKFTDIFYVVERWSEITGLRVGDPLRRTAGCASIVSRLEWTRPDGNRLGAERELLSGGPAALMSGNRHISVPAMIWTLLAVAVAVAIFVLTEQAPAVTSAESSWVNDLLIGLFGDTGLYDPATGLWAGIGIRHWAHTAEFGALGLCVALAVWQCLKQRPPRPARRPILSSLRLELPGGIRKARFLPKEIVPRGMRLSPQSLLAPLDTP